MNWTTLLTNWNLLRVIRLVLGVMIGVQAIATTDWLAGMIAGVFLFQVVTNTGCCGVNGCHTTYQANAASEKEVEFIEVKDTKST